MIARLAHADYDAKIKVLDAKIDEQAAVLRNLETLPRPEEVKLAQEALEVQRMTLSTLKTMNVQMDALRDSMLLKMPTDAPTVAVRYHA